MIRLLLAGYLVVEIAAFAALTYFLGFGWALLITLGAAAIGFAVLGRRARGLVSDLRRASRREPTDGEPASDTALFAGAAVFTILPGVVSTIVGLALMTRPVRSALHPVIDRGIARRTSLIMAGVPGGVGGRYVDGTVEGDVIDQTSDVVDLTPRRPDGTVYVDLPSLPQPPLTRP
ncbi:membrane protein FxsA [Gordonia spumicola]|uniref:Membrane protein FxsA n=1 Tax=Gordonia spumicola TaxID=589161 RepID=A0A7I9VC17_9ACTN|nr:FxsA family protein [Gordonia spumicola]GEE02885.1 membrane protein FxsA [Gordonia spumicola]